MRRSVAVVSLASLALLGACASSGRNDGGRHDNVQANVTPELDTDHKRGIDVDNMIYRSWDTDGRLFWRDLWTATHHDRPSRLVNAPTTY
ncbi:MAG TPA: hypothetical protein VD971_05295 [Phycisphaerales bacterium]|nr:hypothetical protein [Phycisphaerales bacterium]